MQTRKYSVQDKWVTCRLDEDGNRIWICDCPAFIRRLEAYDEGFCSHVACAIEKAAREGHINLPQA